MKYIVFAVTASVLGFGWQLSGEPGSVDLVLPAVIVGTIVAIFLLGCVWRLMHAEPPSDPPSRRSGRPL